MKFQGKLLRWHILSLFGGVGKPRSLYQLILLWSDDLDALHVIRTNKIVHAVVANNPNDQGLETRKVNFLLILNVYRVLARPSASHAHDSRLMSSPLREPCCLP